ncbi:STAS domain-containing protein [Streptomyces sp. NPDC002886]|uniref:STAS domain-containing protein n=1 Tax=Streptomyces sp. NPDC002886 TaxID=3364667 RepID=UPI0036CA420E
MDVEHTRSSVPVNVRGDLADDAGALMRTALDDVTSTARDFLVDLHGVTSMDRDGLLHILELHRYAENLHLRVLVTGWQQPQPQPQRTLAQVAGIPGPSPALGERYALAGFRRLIGQRAQSSRDLADFGAGWLPRP